MSDSLEQLILENQIALMNGIICLMATEGYDEAVDVHYRDLILQTDKANARLGEYIEWVKTH